MKQFYNLTLFVIMLCISSSAFSQIGVQVSYIKPVKDLGYVFKPTVGFEFITNNAEIDDKFRWGISLGYYSFSPRQDTFFSYGTQSGSSSAQYLPAYDIWYAYRVIPLTATFAYKILDRNFSPTIGLDAGMNIVNYHQYTYFETVRSADVTRSSLFIGLFPNIGASTQIGDNVLLSFGMGKSYNLDLVSFKPVQLWKFQLGVMYYID
ncbi:MAG: hypothetical protein H7296_16120 [Bacteroidia bacterium]|nr:hypothetical protein [Bacteroidia bacterium]